MTHPEALKAFNESQRRLDRHQRDFSCAPPNRDPGEAKHASAGLAEHRELVASRDQAREAVAVADPKVPKTRRKARK